MCRGRGPRARRSLRRRPHERHRAGDAPRAAPALAAGVDADERHRRRGRCRPGAVRRRPGGRAELLRAGGRDAGLPSRRRAHPRRTADGRRGAIEAGLARPRGSRSRHAAGGSDPRVDEGRHGLARRPVGRGRRRARRGPGARRRDRARAARRADYVRRRRAIRGRAPGPEGPSHDHRAGRRIGGRWPPSPVWGSTSRRRRLAPRLTAPREAVVGRPLRLRSRACSSISSPSTTHRPGRSTHRCRCSPRQARVARRWRSRAGCWPRRTAACPSTRSPFSCVHRTRISGCSSTRWRAPACRPGSSAGRGVPIRPAARSSPCLRVPTSTCRRGASRSTSPSARCRWPPSARSRSAPSRLSRPGRLRPTTCLRGSSAPRIARKTPRRSRRQRLRPNATAAALSPARSAPRGAGKSSSSRLTSSRGSTGGSGG